MISPMTCHERKRSHVTRGKLAISIRPETIPSIGTSGTRGTRNPLCASGLLSRQNPDPGQTITKAKRVPMLTRLLRSSMRMSPPSVATRPPVARVAIHGVRRIGWMAASGFQSKPSLAIAKRMRDCASNCTIITDINPSIAPTLTITVPQACPVTAIPNAIGSATPSLLYDTSAVNSPDTLT